MARQRPSLATAGPLTLALALAPALASFARAGEKAPLDDRWPGWRGFGQGVARDRHLPLEWSPSKNVLWKAEVGKSQSSPIVAGDRVLVAAEQDFLACVDRATGAVLWRRDNGYGALPAGTRIPEKRPPAAPGCGYSTPTPVADGRLVYARFGTGFETALFGGRGRRCQAEAEAVPAAVILMANDCPEVADDVVSL